MIKLFCATCHIGFSADRSSAKYCSEACKQSAKRRREREFPESNVEEMSDRLLGEIYSLEKFVKNDALDPEAKLKIKRDIELYIFHIEQLKILIDKTCTTHNRSMDSQNN